MTETLEDKCPMCGGILEADDGDLTPCEKIKSTVTCLKCQFSMEDEPWSVEDMLKHMREFKTRYNIP